MIICMPEILLLFPIQVTMYIFFESRLLFFSVNCSSLLDGCS